MTLAQTLGIVLRGMAMGAADVVPGVSGGTIAFVTGIYTRLITSLTSFDLKALSLIVRLRFTDAWKQVDGNFLLALFVGILSSIYLFAHIISYVLEHHPLLLWAFFFGLIFASTIWMLSELDRPAVWDVVPLIAGIAFVFFISTSAAASLSPSLPVVFLAGFVVISAMLLPGVSGSFLLLLVGLYAPTIDAVKNLDFIYMATFASGAAIGFLVFSRLIKWLLTHFYRSTLLFLIGLLGGSLYVVWPWKQVEAEVPTNLLPAAYASEVGDPMILWVLLSMAAGAAIVLSFELMFGKSNKEMGVSE